MFHLGHADSPAPVNGINSHSEDTNQDPVPKTSLRLGFSEYCRISNLLVLHLRKMEEGGALPGVAHMLICMSSSHINRFWSLKIVFCQKRW